MDLISSELGLIFWIVIIGFAVILPILALISVVLNQFQNNEKLIWVLVVLLAPMIGSIVYFIVGRPKRLIHKIV